MNKEYDEEWWTSWSEPITRSVRGCHREVNIYYSIYIMRHFYQLGLELGWAALYPGSPGRPVLTLSTFCWWSHIFTGWFRACLPGFCLFQSGLRWAPLPSPWPQTWSLHPSRHPLLLPEVKISECWVLLPGKVWDPSVAGESYQDSGCPQSPHPFWIFPFWPQTRLNECLTEWEFLERWFRGPIKNY